MKIAIVGFGSQGKSSLEYWQALGHEVVVCDKNPDVSVPESVTTITGDSYLTGLSDFDLIVRSPSVHPRELNHVPQEKITSNTNEFFAVCPSKNIIGVTGTKGKGTTSTLIAKMLEADGKRVHLGGNIGTPPLELLKNDIRPEDWVVLELANFQLIDLRHSPHLGVCLMVVPEHLDWHEDFEEYVAAKQQLFIHQEPDDIAIYYAENENSLSIADASLGQLIPYYKPPGAVVKNHSVTIADQAICRTDELKLLGKHNWQNVCAAITAMWQVTQNADAIRSVLTSFSGLEHRLEFVREFNGVKYYDDSFGTTPETAIVAIEAFREPKVVILGGSDKGASFGELVKTVVNSNVKHAVLIGNTANVIADAIKTVDNSFSFTQLEGMVDMKQIVATANEKAISGDIVLLSTGCASFGLFENYKDRGEKFIEAVQALA